MSEMFWNDMPNKAKCSECGGITWLTQYGHRYLCVECLNKPSASTWKAKCKACGDILWLTKDEWLADERLCAECLKKSTLIKFLTDAIDAIPSDVVPNKIKCKVCGAIAWLTKCEEGYLCVECLNKPIPTSMIKSSPETDSLWVFDPTDYGFTSRRYMASKADGKYMCIIWKGLKKNYKFDVYKLGKNYPIIRVNFTIPNKEIGKIVMEKFSSLRDYYEEACSNTKKQIQEGLNTA